MATLSPRLLWVQNISGFTLLFVLFDVGLGRFCCPPCLHGGLCGNPSPKEGTDTLDVNFGQKMKVARANKGHRVAPATRGSKYFWIHIFPFNLHSEKWFEGYHVKSILFFSGWQKQNLQENWVSKQSFFVLILTTAKKIFFLGIKLFCFSR